MEKTELFLSNCRFYKDLKKYNVEITDVASRNVEFESRSRVFDWNSYLDSNVEFDSIPFENFTDVSKIYLNKAIIKE